MADDGDYDLAVAATIVLSALKKKQHGPLSSVQERRSIFIT